MKILLREHGNKVYTWETAKYDNGLFYVDGIKVRESYIISIENDNRKNYIQCSCCGKVFRKGDVRFQIHKENAIKPDTCFNCPSLCTDVEYVTKQKYQINPEGGFIEKLEREVELRCNRSGLWTYDDIMSDAAINRCKKRQCGDAYAKEIMDFFTKYPKAFDDIITIDALLDNGYDVGIGGSYDFNVEDEYTIGVLINKLGIVDYFYVWYDGSRYWFNYSKKYDELFWDEGNNRYSVFNLYDMTTEIRNEIKNKIAKLYR